MNDEDRQLIRAHQQMEKWAQLKHWITEGLCIGCGGEPSVKLYVHFCDQCLYEAGVKIEFVDPPNDGSYSSEHPPPSEDNIGAEWLLFIAKLYELNDQRG